MIEVLPNKAILVDYGPLHMFIRACKHGPSLRQWLVRLLIVKTEIDAGGPAATGSFLRRILHQQAEAKSNQRQEENRLHCHWHAPGIGNDTEKGDADPSCSHT
jgi:hypothetical protein